MARMTQEAVKEQLVQKAQGQSQAVSETDANKKGLSMKDMVQVMMPEIKKALPQVMTPERFTRIALSALSANPTLQQCTPISFMAALMNAAQLGLEPNTPLGQAYLIPYKNRGVLECQFQIGYKGLIDLAYRNGNMQTIQAQVVYSNDEFYYEYGLEPKLIHRPADFDRGEPVYFYGVFRTMNGGYGFHVMSKDDMDSYAKKYSKSYESSNSPWILNYEEMAKKTVIKQALKYAPIKTEFQRALTTDESVKKELSDDMFIVQNEVLDLEA